MWRLIRQWLPLLGLLFLAAGRQAQAGVRFAQTAIEAGEVRAGAPLSREFRFLNDGPETAELLEVEPSCGCVRPGIRQRVFPAGEGGQIALEVNTLGQADGPHTWQLTVRFRRGQQIEDVLLKLHARVVTELSVQPAALLLCTGGTVRQEVVLTDLRPQPLAGIDLRTTSNRLAATLLEQKRDGNGHQVFRIGLETAAGGPDGRHEEVLDIFTRDPLYGHLQVPVTIVQQSQERLAVLPHEVSFRGAPGQPLASQLLRVRDGHGEAIQIEAVTADDPALQCRWAVGPENQATIRVQVNRDRLHGSRLDSALHIRLSGPVRQTLTVPVRCVIE
jgi:hypothetical protein